MRRSLITALIMALIVISFTTHGLPEASDKPAGFSGDVVITEPDSIIKAKLYVKGPIIHRVEMSEDDGGMVFIRPPDARGKIWMLDPAKKQYTILSAGLPAREDPLEAWTDIPNDMQGGPGGDEVLDGHPCKVYHFKYSDEDPVTVRVWFAEDLKHEIRVEADAELAIGMGEDSSLIYRKMKGTFEVLNIRLQEPSDSLFEIPPDYVDAGKTAPREEAPKEIADLLVGRWDIAPTEVYPSGYMVFYAEGTYEMVQMGADGVGAGTKGEYKLDTTVDPVRIDLCLDKCGKPGSEWTTRFGIIRVLSNGKLEIRTSPDSNHPSTFSDDPADLYTMILTRAE
jgi:hypothetical protein